MTDIRYYMACLDLRGRECLVVGGGRVATEKVHGLLDCEAKVTVVAPQVDHDLRRLPVRVERRPFSRSDVVGRFLVVAATNDRSVNAAVSAVARERETLCNVADDPELCSFILPAIVRRDAARRQRNAGEGRDGGERRQPRHDLVLDACGGERLHLLEAAAEDERIASLEPHDGAPAPAVVDEQLVHLLLGQPVARDSRSARRLRDEPGGDEAVVDQDLARADELQGAHRHQAGVAGAGAYDRDAHTRSSAGRAGTCAL